MNMDSLVIDIQSTSTDATKSIDTLITRLSNLRDVLKEVSTASNGLSNLKKIGNGVRTSSSSKIPKTEQSKMLYKNIDVRPAFEKIAGDIGKVDSATSMLRNKFNTLGISLKDTKIISTFSDANKVITKYVTKTGSVITVTDKLRGAFGKVDVSVKKTNTSTKKFSDDFKKTTDIINKVNVALLGAVTGFVRLAKKMGDLVNQAGAEQEALNLFTVTMGQYAKQGVEWIERFSDALYLDPVSVMQYMGSFNSLVKGLGVGAENSYKMSQNLTQLVYDLASFKNITITSAYEKLMSGVSGELEPLRNVGVAMSEATLQTLAYELGIEKLVRNMTEAEKAQLRYIQIMRSSTEWQTDMGRTLITPTNALRVMRQQFTLLGRAIGKVFIPIVMEAIPYVIAITQLLTALANKIANLLGYKIADIDYSSLGGISAGIQDIGDSAEDTADKLNTMLAPFDDLNVVQKQTEKAGSGLGAFGGDLGIDLPTYDALANLNTKFAEEAEKARKSLEGLLPIVTGIGLGLAAWKITKSVIDFITWWDSLTGGGKTAAKIGLTIGLAIGLAFLGYKFITDGNEDVMNEETLLKGVGEHLFGSGLFGVVAGMLTKNITIGMFIGFAILGFTGSKTASHGDWQNGILGFLQQGVSIAGIAGLAFKLSGGNIELTLGIAALVTWANVFFNFGELLAMKPTWEEICNAVATLMEDSLLYQVSVAIEEVFTEFGYAISDKLWDTWDSIKEFWKTNVAPIFTKEWWETNVGYPISQAFDDIKDNVSKTWDETWDDVENTLKTKWTEAKTWFTDNFGTKKDWKEIFKSLIDGASETLNELKQKFENWTAKIKTPHLEWKQNGIQATGTIKKILETLNLPTSLPKLNVAWYEQGGFPTSGDLFFANENGVPEMIGRIGNQTAVANNDQIATSLTNALISALNQYDFGGGQSPTTIYIGNRKVYEGYGEHVANENDRYGTNMIKI